MVLHALTHGEGGRQPMPFVRRPASKKKEAEKSQAKQAKKENSLLLLPFPRKSFENPYFHYVFTTYYVSGVRACGGGGRPGEGRGGKSENVHTAAEVSFFSFFVFLSFFRGEAVYFSKSALLQVLVRRCALRSRGAHEIGGGESPRLGSHLCLLLLLLLIPPSFPLCFGKGGVGSGVQAGYGMVVAQLRERGGGGRWEKSFVRSSRKGREKEEGRGGRMDTSSSPPRKLIFFPMPHHDIHQGHSRCLPPHPVLCYSTN